MTTINKIFTTLGLVFLLSISGCNTLKKGVSGLNLFPVSEDVKLGLQVSEQIESDRQQFPLLPETGSNKQIYSYVRKMTKKLLNTGHVKHKDDFAWQVKIIDDAKTLNAFATPGGYIYVYTGLIKFLDSEDQLAGVMGHEIAHAAQRHSTRQMTKSMGVSILAQAVLGQSEALNQVVNGLVGLKFSRAHESESDEMSVIYLCETDYNAAGAAGFFKKMEGQGGTPEFLSTHPNPANRVSAIEKKAKELGCKGRKTYKTEYAKIKSLIK